MHDQLAASFEAIANYNNNRIEAGRYSPTEGTLSQDLVGVPTQIVNIRSMPNPPSLDVEGFAVVDHAVEDRWHDRAWIDSEYVTTCLDLVKRLTGAVATLAMYAPVLRSSAVTPGSVETAAFVHLDQPRDTYRAQAVARAARDGYTLRRASIYNVWKAFTPPPQDRPLALLDRRAIDQHDYIRGFNVFDEGRILIPFYGVAAPDSAPPMHAAPDLGIDESIIFIAADFDDRNSLGCAHTAVELSYGQEKPVPRQSVEVRVLTLFD